MGSTINSFAVSQLGSLISKFRWDASVRHRSVSSRKLIKFRADSSRVYGISAARQNENNGDLSSSGKTLAADYFEGNEGANDAAEILQPLWDDGFGTQTFKDYLEIAKDIVRPDYGPPRWFCPIECGCPLKDSPVLLYLPGLDGLGLGLILQHKALGKVFEVRCMHIPVFDRTPFQGLVNFVENAVKLESASSPKKPIYLVAESIGACIALSVAARNPVIDLVVILINPATSYSRSQLRLLLPLLEALPDQLCTMMPYLFSMTSERCFHDLGDSVKRAMLNISGFSLAEGAKEVFRNLAALSQPLFGLIDIMPVEFYTWKLKMLKTAAAYANSRLHAVKAEVLVLASGKDNMFPSEDEGRRLSDTVGNCNFRCFKDNGHTLLLEGTVNLLTVIKGTGHYRRKTKRDEVSDYVPPSLSEYKLAFDKILGYYRLATSPVMYSTLEDSNIVRGLRGVPDKGPVLLVGYHMLLGAEIYSLVEGFLREKNMVVRGLSHPEMFTKNFGSKYAESSNFDLFKVFGALPVSERNLFRLFSAKSHVLLYPGGVREALHRKGESYKLFWPEQPEFVRMAVKFGVTIVPFGVVGVDDIVELFLDYNEQMRIPFLNQQIRQQNHNAIKLRNRIERTGEEVSHQDLFVPGFYPKIPGRFYFLFGKPIETEGMKECLKDEKLTKILYKKIKSEVEKNIAYLLEKREQDPYRNILKRMAYCDVSMHVDHVPSFDT
ncbi:phytyl ester synthase 1, chloroplastic isoform X1 [Coffea arabica]|uniref:Phytyl ester synthase 1, chloroplastic isoform X1 n=1 Tax=Coffea arabica TaxID=13443 RepID=A0ABM4WNP4_COFAR